MEIITDGEEFVMYLYENNYENELQELFEQYFEEIKKWDKQEIELFFEKNNAIEYFEKLYNEKKFEKRELYLKGFEKYKSQKEYDKFIEFCNDYYYALFEGDSDFLKNTITNDVIYFYKYRIDVILIYGDYIPYEIDIIKKFANYKKYYDLFDRYERFEGYKHIPIKEFESRYKYVIYYRGGVGYIFDVFGYVPSKIKR